MNNERHAQRLQCAIDAFKVSWESTRYVVPDILAALAKWDAENPVRLTEFQTNKLDCMISEDYSAETIFKWCASIILAANTPPSEPQQAQDKGEGVREQFEHSWFAPMDRHYHGSGYFCRYEDEIQELPIGFTLDALREIAHHVEERERKAEAERVNGVTGDDTYYTKAKEQAWGDLTRAVGIEDAGAISTYIYALIRSEAAAIAAGGGK